MSVRRAPATQNQMYGDETHAQHDDATSPECSDFHSGSTYDGGRYQMHSFKLK